MDRKQRAVRRENLATWSLSARRAWIENVKVEMPNIYGVSLSARRAWIEKLVTISVALMIWSLSARRAWIENRFISSRCHRLSVALRKESVDRKMGYLMNGDEIALCRSPQGERG